MSTRLQHHSRRLGGCPLPALSPPGPGRTRNAQAEVLAYGLLAGAVGVAAMTLAEKIEQALTGRSNSYVPAHTLERLLGLRARPDEERSG